ncbi:short-chain dehydrogenase [Astrocystis sublimbata]|nr:short-chain dehydrogenase [Astrocystis sublimbata]
MSKAFIVTGASRGLGLAITEALLREKHNVFAVARTEADLRKLKDKHGDDIEYMATDVSENSETPKIVAAAVHAFGKLDGLVINHGTLKPIGKIADADPDAWGRAFNVNFISAVALLQQAIPKLRESKGRVVFVSSGASSSAYVGWGMYGTSKAALDHLCAHLAVEEPTITAVTVSPGKVDTEMQKLIRDDGHNDGMSKEVHASFVAEHENGKLLKPEQPGTVIAKLVVGATRALAGKHFRWNAAELADFQSK